MLKPQSNEITYDEVASLLKCTPRHARRVIRLNKVKPSIYGHRTVRFPIEKIIELKRTLEENGRRVVYVFVTKKTNGHAPLPRVPLIKKNGGGR